MKDFDIAELDFNSFVDYRNNSFALDYESGNYSKKCFPFINDNLIDIGFQEFQDKRVFPSIDFTFHYKEFWYWSFNSKDTRFLEYCINCSNKKRTLEAIKLINQQRFNIRKKILKKFYKSVLACVIDELFGKNVQVTHFNFTIYNFHKYSGESNIYTPLYIDENYLTPKLTLKNSFKNVCMFLNLKNACNYTSLETLVTNIAFIEIYSNIGTLLFRIINNCDESFKLLKSAMVEKRKDIYSNDDLEELRYYSGIDIYKVLEIKDGIYNFE